MHQPFPLAHETHFLLVLGQEWQQDVAGLVLWIEEKGLRAAEEPSRKPSDILQQAAWHEATKRELLASSGHVEGLQQVGVLDRGCRAHASSNPQPSWVACFHGTNLPKEDSISVSSELGSPSFLLHSAGYPSVLVPKPAQNIPFMSSHHPHPTPRLSGQL